MEQTIQFKLNGRPVSVTTDGERALLLLKNARPDKAEIIENMNLHLCRCGTYSRGIEAIQTAAAELKGGGR